MHYEDFRAKMSDLPFKPFRLHLSDGSRMDVIEPALVSPGLTAVLVPSSWGKDNEGHKVVAHWRSIAYSHIVQFGDIDETVEHKRRKRK